MQYSLLGDPALSLNLPTLNIVIDSIDGSAISNSGQIKLKGGTIATVKGHIEKNATKVENFNGLMSATVRDTRELITCKGQEETTNTPFSYYDRQKYFIMVPTVFAMANLNLLLPFLATLIILMVLVL